MTSLFTCVFPYKMQNLGGPSVMKKKNKKTTTQKPPTNKKCRHSSLPTLCWSCWQFTAPGPIVNPKSPPEVLRGTPNPLLNQSGEPQILVSANTAAVFRRANLSVGFLGF